MTDQRDRVITDPGIGPVGVDSSSSLRAIAGAEEIEPDGASLYYEPKALISPSDHKTLEVATVRLADDIDPRRLPTALSLARSPLPPPAESAWPPADVVLTSSQRPSPLKHRWRTPALLLGAVGLLLAFLVARGALHYVREQVQPTTAERAEGAPGIRPMPESRVSATAVSGGSMKAGSASAGSALAGSVSAAPAVKVSPTTTSMVLVLGQASASSAALPASAVTSLSPRPPLSPLPPLPPVSASLSPVPSLPPGSGVPSAGKPRDEAARGAHPSSEIPGKLNLPASGSGPLSAPSAATAKRAIY